MKPAIYEYDITEAFKVGVQHIKSAVEQINSEYGDNTAKMPETIEFNGFIIKTSDYL